MKIILLIILFLIGCRESPSEKRWKEALKQADKDADTIRARIDRLKEQYEMDSIS